MRTELPVLKRCCICLPLRYGLITCGYLRLVTAIFIVIRISISFYKALEVVYMHPEKHVTTNTVILSFVIIMMLVDIILNTIFVVGGHKKNFRMLRVYYIYCQVLLILTTLMGTASLINMMSWYKIGDLDLHFHIWIILVDVCTLLTHVLIQAYILLLVRSEIVKLRSNCQFSFVNNAAESKCAMKCEEEVNGEQGTDFICEQTICVSD